MAAMPSPRTAWTAKAAATARPAGEQVAGAADGEAGQQQRARRRVWGTARRSPGQSARPYPGQQRVAGRQPDADGGHSSPAADPPAEGVGGQEDQGHVVDAGAGHHGHVATDDRPQDRLAPQ